MGSRWTGKKSDHQNYDDVSSVNVDNTEPDDDHEKDDTVEESNDESSSSHDYDPDEYEDFSDMENTSNPSFFEKIQESVRTFLQAVNPFQTTVNTSEAESVRKVYDEASEKLSTLKSKICRLTKKLVNDFGPKKEFYSLHGRCFKTKQNKFQPF